MFSLWKSEREGRKEGKRERESWAAYYRILAHQEWAAGGLPWWCSGWEWFEPWSGKIPHAAEQLGPWATTTEPARLEPVLRKKRGHDSERPALRDEEWPPLAATRESPSTERKTQHSNQSIDQSLKKKKELLGLLQILKIFLEIWGINVHLFLYNL